MHDYTPLIPAVLMLAAFLFRKFAPAGGFLHTPAGAWVISGVSTLLGGVAQGIQEHGLSKVVVITAIASGILSLIGTANPSLAKDGSSKAPDDSLLVLLLIPALLCAGCNWEQFNVTPPGFVFVAVGLLVALVVVRALARIGRRGAPMVIALVLPALLAAGCPAHQSGATLGERLRDDVAAAKKIVSDVKTKCGPELAQVAPIIQQALLLAKTAPDAAAIIMAVFQAVPALIQVGSGVWCAIKTITEDLKAMGAQPPTITPETAPIGSPEHGAFIGDQLLRMRASIKEPTAYLLDPDPIPHVCDVASSDGAEACRPLALDDSAQLTSVSLDWNHAPPMSSVMVPVYAPKARRLSTKECTRHIARLFHEHGQMPQRQARIAAERACEVRGGIDLPAENCVSGYHDDLQIACYSGANAPRRMVCHRDDQRGWPVPCGLACAHSR